MKILNLITTLKRLEALGKEHYETTYELITLAQQIDPNIRTRNEALELASRISKIELKEWMRLHSRFPVRDPDDGTGG